MARAEDLDGKSGQGPLARDSVAQARVDHKELWQTGRHNMARPENWPRTILHVDLDAFYTSVHQRDDPKLRGVPVVVAGRSRRAVVMGSSYEARAYGVRSAMPLHEAVQLYPQLTVIAPDSARYRDASRLVHQIFRRFTSPELVEGIALDEAYLDVTARTRHGTSTAADPPRPSRPRRRSTTT